MYELLSKSAISADPEICTRAKTSIVLLHISGFMLDEIFQ